MTAMAKIYVKRIKSGKMALEDVPPTWYEEVAAVLAAE